MSEPKAYFRFATDPKVVVSNKKTLSEMARRHITDAAQFTGHTEIRLRQVIGYLDRLMQMEHALLERDLLDDTSEELKDVELLESALKSAYATQQFVIALHERKLARGVEFEEAVEREIQLQQEREARAITKKARKAASAVPPPAPSPNKPASAAPAPSVTPNSAASAVPPPSLVLPPELVDRARADAEKAENARKSAKDDY